MGKRLLSVAAAKSHSMRHALCSQVEIRNPHSRSHIDEMSAKKHLGLYVCYRASHKITHALRLQTEQRVSDCDSCIYEIYADSFVHLFTGYTDKETALLQIPGGVIAVASVLMATWSASKFNARAANIIFWSLLGGIIGGSLLAFLPETSKGALAGNYITHVVGAFLPCSYSFASANTAGHTKKVTMNAILLMSFCLGNILGPLTFRDEDAPSYTPAKITIVAVDLVAVSTMRGERVSRTA